MSGLSETDIRAHLGAPDPEVARLNKPALTAQMQAFLARSPLIWLATVDEDGFPTVTPRGDAPGVLEVVDDRTLLLPERHGNANASALRAIARDGRIGLSAIVPRSPEVLRLRGRAEVSADPALCARLARREGPALLVIRISLDRAWFHCGKALSRSRLWRPEGWPDRFKVSLGQELAAGDEVTAAVDAHLDRRYRQVGGE